MSFSSSSSGGKYSHLHCQTGRFSSTKGYVNGVGYKYTNGETVVSSNTDITTSTTSNVMPYIVAFFWRRTS